MQNTTEGKETVGPGAIIVPFGSAVGTAAYASPTTSTGALLSWQPVSTS
jgi:hypothetical protein